MPHCVWHFQMMSAYSAQFWRDVSNLAAAPQVASLRNIPNLDVYRPGDADETAAAYVRDPHCDPLGIGFEGMCYTLLEATWNHFENGVEQSTL